MIRAAVVEKRYGGATILRDVALEVEAGECVALLGPSGVGKSTLMRIAAGLDRAFTGTAERPAKCAMAFQEPNLLPWRSVWRNLALFHPDLPKGAIAAILARVGLAGKEALFPGQLSLGQQRRLALARAFAGRPQALFLDEPFVSLDTVLAADMLALTQDLIAEARPAVLFITHAAEEAAQMASRSYRLVGSPATLHLV